MNKHELLERIRKGRDEVTALCAGLSEEVLDRLPGPKPDWSAKDLLAHLAYWEHPTLDRLAGRSTFTSFPDVHAINAQLILKSRQRSVIDVLREFTESELRVIQQIENLTDEDLRQDSPWKDGKPLWHHLADDTCEHYEEHLPALRVWAQSVRN